MMPYNSVKRHAVTSKIDVSFAVACYNAQDYLEAAVRSALAQDGVSLEVLVVDDGSRDASRDIAARLAAEDPRVIPLCTPQNSGPGGARNVALNAMRGKWYAVLDADDLLLPGRTDFLLSQAREWGCDMICDNLLEFGEGISEHPMFAIAPPGGARQLELAEYLHRSRLFGEDANPGYLKPMIRREAIERTELRYDTALRVGEDDELVIRALSQGLHYVVCDYAGYRYRKHDASISHRLSLAHLDRMIGAERKIAAGLPGAIAQSAAYRSRWEALERARAFTMSIDALKDRAPLSALAALVRKPSAIRLYSLPLMARLRRFIGKFKRLSAD